MLKTIHFRVCVVAPTGSPPATSSPPTQTPKNNAKRTLFVNIASPIATRGGKRDNMPKSPIFQTSLIVLCRGCIKKISLMLYIKVFSEFFGYLWLQKCFKVENRPTGVLTGH